MDSSSTTAPNIIDVNSLSIEELSSLQQQLNAEITFFNESLDELRNVCAKFGRCKITLDSINETENDKPALIPLSESVSL